MIMTSYLECNPVGVAVLAGVGALLDGDYDHGGGIEVSRRVLRNSELKPAGKTDLSESIEL